MPHSLSCEFHSLAPAIDGRMGRRRRGRRYVERHAASESEPVGARDPKQQRRGAAHNNHYYYCHDRHCQYGDDPSIVWRARGVRARGFKNSRSKWSRSPCESAQNPANVESALPRGHARRWRRSSWRQPPPPQTLGRRPCSSCHSTLVLPIGMLLCICFGQSLESLALIVAASYCCFLQNYLRKRSGFRDSASAGNAKAVDSKKVAKMAANPRRESRSRPSSTSSISTSAVTRPSNVAHRKSSLDASSSSNHHSLGHGYRRKGSLDDTGPAAATAKAAVCKISDAEAVRRFVMQDIKQVRLLLG